MTNNPDGDFPMGALASNISRPMQPQFGPGNPLQKYFRAPGMHLFLPTRGYFSNPGDLELTINGELPVYPMTASDELLLKSPDALLNGFAVEKVIMSCAPGIHNVRNIPSPDIDAILLAIRASTYGDQLEMEIDCPKCQYHNSFTTSIHGALQVASKFESSYPIRLSDNVVVYVKPFTFECNTKAALMAFEESKTLQVAEQQNVPDTDKIQIITQSYERISELNLALNSHSVIKVIIPEGEVTDQGFILEFLRNTDKNSYEKIDEKIKELNEMGVNKKQKVECEKCHHTWESELVFDPSHFFG